MRLIDADEFRRVLRERQTDAKHYEDMELRQEIGEIIEALDKQPTAYDVKKVIAMITDEMDCQKEKRETARKAGIIELVNLHKYAECCYSLAIEVVKRGGVND